jgi:uncharacterized protein YbjT (DUF2867 family)
LHAAKREHSAVVDPPKIRAGVLITGGTGSLGTVVAKELVASGRPVRSVSRRVPAGWDQVAGVEYVVADLSQPLPADLFQGID